MAKAFVKTLGRCLAQEFGDSIEDSKLRDSFVQAIKNLPAGKLRDDLNLKFEKHLHKLERQLKGVQLTELPPLNSSVDENLDELTKSDLDGRKDVAEQDYKQQKLLYNLFGKKIKKPNVKEMKRLTNKQRILTYCVFLKNVLDNHDVTDSLVEATVQDFSENCQLQSDIAKGKFEWMSTCDVLLQLTTGSKPLAYIRVLKTVFNSVQNDVNCCLAKGKAVRAGRLAATLKKFMMTSHVEVSCQPLEKGDTKQYCQLMSALLSFYVDLCAVHSSKVESKSVYGREIAGFVGYILQPWPESRLELLLQLSCWEDDDKFPVVWPLLNKSLEVKPHGKDYSYYLKYVLLMRHIKDALGELESIENWNIQTKSIPAGKGFIKWLGDHCPQAMEHIPSEDKKFKKTTITRFLLEEAEDDLLALLLDSFSSETVASADVADRSGEKETLEQMAMEELFYLDNGGENSQIAEEAKDVSGSDAIIVKTLADMEQLVNKEIQDKSFSTCQVYKLDDEFAKNLTRDPDARKFFQSEIVSITSLQPEADMEEELELDEDFETTQESVIRNDSISKRSDESGSVKKKKKSSSSTPDRKKSEQEGVGKDVGSVVEITETLDSDISAIEVNDGTFVSENTVSDDNVGMKSIVHKVSPKKMADRMGRMDEKEDNLDSVTHKKGANAKDNTSNSVITITDSEMSDVSSVDESEITSIDIDTSLSLVHQSVTGVVESGVYVEDKRNTLTTKGSTYHEVDSSQTDESKQDLDDTVKFMGKSLQRSTHTSVSDSNNKEQKSPRKQSSNNSNDKIKTVDNDGHSINTTEKINGQNKSFDTNSSKLSELHGEMESDGDVFMNSPKKNINKTNGKGTTSMQEKFIVKATQGKVARKSVGKMDLLSGSVSLTNETSPKQGDKFKDASRTKSTEEIITIVEEIKEKIQTPQNRRTPNKANQNESMFTDDSIESVEKINSSVSSESSEKLGKVNAGNKRRKSSGLVSSCDDETIMKDQAASKRRRNSADKNIKGAELKEKGVDEAYLVIESCSDSEYGDDVPESKIVSDSDPEPESDKLRNKSPKVNKKQLDLSSVKSLNVDMMDGDTKKSPRGDRQSHVETPISKTPKSAKKKENTPGKKTPTSNKKTDKMSGNKTPASGEKIDDLHKNKTPNSAKKIDNVSGTKTPNSTKKLDFISGKQTLSSGKKKQIASVDESPISARKQSSSDLHSPESANKRSKNQTPKSGRKGQNESITKSPGSSSTSARNINSDKTQETAEGMGKINTNYLSPAVALSGSQKINSPPPRKYGESDDDMIPSSHKKRPMGQSHDSENDTAALPDIAIHLKSDVVDGGLESPSVPGVSEQTPVDSKEEKKTPEKPKRTTRRSGIMKTDLIEADSNAVPTRQLRNRTASESSTDIGPSEPKKIRTASARKSKKISDVLHSVPESVAEEPALKTPKSGNRPRNVSASTSKKFVNKVEQLKGTRKRRLSSEFSDQDRMSNLSSDSEVSFPRLKKVSAATTNVPVQKRNLKRLSAPPAAANQESQDTDAQGRRYSLRKR